MHAKLNDRVPVHAVSGPAGARRAWLAATGPTCASLAPASCPCCTGRVELQVKLARLLRERRPARVFVELDDEAHLATFERALAEWPLAQYVQAARAIRLPEDAGVDPASLTG